MYADSGAVGGAARLLPARLHLCSRWTCAELHYNPSNSSRWLAAVKSCLKMEGVNPLEYLGWSFCADFCFVEVSLSNLSSSQSADPAWFCFFPGNQKANMKTGSRSWQAASSLKNTGYLLAGIPDFTPQLQQLSTGPRRRWPSDDVIDASGP